MFNYTVPKSSCWGHVIRPKDPLKAKQRVNAFFEIYFEKLDPEWEVTRQMTVDLSWRAPILPNIEWPEELSRPETQKTFFILTGDRVIFMGGLLIPISSSASSSYEFLRRFVSDAPFRMSPKNFRVSVPAKRGKWKWTKPEGEIAERLLAVFA